MSRSRPASNPLSYHKHTGQYYVTRSGKRVHSKLRIQDFTVEMFAAWKMSLRKQDYSPESINHYEICMECREHGRQDIML